jgi:aldose 1-epimerase
MASFPLIPWSNRISAGGFDHHAEHYSMPPNREGEPYPIHGDGWQQPWDIHQPEKNTLEMTLTSQAFHGNPYTYKAVQRFVLLEGGMDQTLTVTHTGAKALPYGLGQHPWFLRSPNTRLKAHVQGVWLSGADPLPTVHTTQVPPKWDPRPGMEVSGFLLDNAYTGWSGEACITWPEHHLQLTVRQPDVQSRALHDGYCLVYLPPSGLAFCFEPVTHPVDAFHLPGCPGLRELQTGESLSLRLEWRFTPIPPLKV